MASCYHLSVMHVLALFFFCFKSLPKTAGGGVLGTVVFQQQPDGVPGACSGG